MAFPVKMCLSLCGAAGVSSAVSIPLVLNKAGSPSLGEQGGAVKNKLESQFLLSSCSSNDSNLGEEISYGKQEVKDVCGTVESKGENTEIGGENYTSLFQETGSNTEQNWKNGSVFGGGGSQQCMEDQSTDQGAILLSPDNGYQHLGYCGESPVAKTKFVKKYKDTLKEENENSGSLGICTEDCGNINSSAISGSPEVLQTEKGDKGKKVKFYEKNKS